MAKKISIIDKGKDIDRSKLGKRSKNKGASFERMIAKEFKEHYNIELVRTPQSGGFAKKSDEYKGDISTADKSKKLLLHIECKSQKTLKLKEWIEQAESDCPTERIPIVVFHKHNSSKNYAVIELHDFMKLVEKEKIIKEV